MASKEIKDSAERIVEATDSFHKTAKSVEDATASVQRAASAVDSNVSTNIQPDIRQIRQWLSEVDQKADVRLKRILWALWALAALNLAILIVTLIG